MCRVGVNCVTLGPRPVAAGTDLGGVCLPDNPCVTPSPAWSLMLMGSVMVKSEIGIFFSVS